MKHVETCVPNVFRLQRFDQRLLDRGPQLLASDARGREIGAQRLGIEAYGADVDADLFARCMRLAPDA